MKNIIKITTCILTVTIIVFVACKKEAPMPLQNNQTTNKPPIAKAGVDQIITLPNDSAFLNGSNSNDADGVIVSYSWKKISGDTSSTIVNYRSVQTLVKSLNLGVFQFELTVADNGGLSAKDTMQVNVITVISSCPDRPIINARLVPLGSLSTGAIGLVSATANNKILFAGGFRDDGKSGRVDIYDIPTNSWSTAELSLSRPYFVAASVGSKIFFAGGEEDPWGASLSTSRVDIYDASNNSWSTAELSVARAGIATASIGSKVFFAGGNSWQNGFVYYNVVDIYDNATNTWSTAQLSENRTGISATTAGNKIYYAGGIRGINQAQTTTIDIFDAATNTWSTSNLLEAKSDMPGIAAANKIYWAGGINSSGSLSDKVEIRDLITGVSSSNCVIPRLGNSAVIKNDNIVFFTGYEDNHPFEGLRFEIYNLTTNTWSTGVLNQKIFDATVISVNNVIYVAGGRGTVQGPQGYGGPYFKQVWKLEF